MRTPLWAPWRMTYVGAPRPHGCLFCDAGGGAGRDRLVLGWSAHALVMLNRYPYQSGHVLIAPRRHGADLGSLPDAEYDDLQRTLRRTMVTVAGSLRPDGMNVGLNVGAAAGAGILDHVHWHVVPRWEGDTNFMPVLAEVRVMPRHLLDTYEHLRPAFAWLDAPAGAVVPPSASGL